MNLRPPESAEDWKDRLKTNLVFYRCACGCRASATPHHLINAGVTQAPGGSTKEASFWRLERSFGVEEGRDSQRSLYFGPCM